MLPDPFLLSDFPSLHMSMDGLASSPPPLSPLLPLAPPTSSSSGWYLRAKRCLSIGLQRYPLSLHHIAPPPNISFSSLSFIKHNNCHQSSALAKDHLRISSEQLQSSPHRNHHSQINNDSSIQKQWQDSANWPKSMDAARSNQTTTRSSLVHFYEVTTNNDQ